MMRTEPELTVALTGAGGFIGSHLAHLLLRSGIRVRALVRYGSQNSVGYLGEVLDEGRRAEEEWTAQNRLQIVHGDILDPRCVRELVRDCDTVFHLAALIGIPYSYRAPESYLQVNVQGTMNLLEACREECPERIIVTSTSEVYGTARETPMTERHPLQAQSPYAASKTAADKFAESYYLSFGLPVTTVRPFNAYGPRQSARAVIPTILAQALSEDCPAIRLGNLNSVRDMNYVEDTARAFIAVARAPIETVVGKVFNVASRSGLSVREIAEIAMKVVGVRKPIESEAERLRPDASEVLKLVGDSDRIRTEVGWRPEVALEEGLARTARWISAHADAFEVKEHRI